MAKTMSKELKSAQARWSAQYEQMAATLGRQKEAINRLLEANTQQNMMLHKIAEDEELPMKVRLMARAIIDNVNLLLAPAAEEEVEGD